MNTARFSPEYLQDSVIYQLFLRTFTPEGTFNAAAKLLPHLAEIGVDIVYLCPITTADDDMDQDFWSDRQKKSGLNNPRNPYRVKDYFAIDPEYGTNEDFAAFVSIAHQLGLSVMLDLVYYHCGPTAKLIQENPDFIKRDENGKPICGEWHFPQLNFDNEDLREYLFQNMEYFVKNFGVDGYRCDVAPAVPLDFWDEARARLDDINPDLILLAEGEVPEYLEDAFDISYSFKWSAAITAVFDQKASAQHLQEVWQEQNDQFPIGAFFLRCFDNHDIANDNADNRQEKRWSQDANDAALLLNFTVDGIPMLYNGQEIADATKHSIYGNRDCAHNACINWSKLLTSEGQARLEFFKKLSELRHETPTLNDGALTWVTNSTPSQVVSFLRTPDLIDEELIADEDECGCGCHCHDDEDEDHHCHCHDDEDEDHHCHCQDDEDYDDEDYDDEDDCDCGDEHEHGVSSNVLVVINASDKPLASTLDIALERGTLLNVKMLKGATYKPNGDHLDVCMLPYGFLVIEF